MWKSTVCLTLCLFTAVLWPISNTEYVTYVCEIYSEAIQSQVGENIILAIWRKTDTQTHIACHNQVCEGWHNLQQGLCTTQGLCVITPNIFVFTALGSTSG